MTAITPSYAHAYLATCLAQHLPGVPHHNFRLPISSPVIIVGGLFCTDGGTRVVDGDDIKTFVDFVDDLDIEEDVLAAKRSHEDEDTSGGESDETSGAPALSESDADIVPNTIEK